jgi:hypothetical protein
MTKIFNIILILLVVTAALFQKDSGSASQVTPANLMVVTNISTDGSGKVDFYGHCR